jgi:hypothetical protein
VVEVERSDGTTRSVLVDENMFAFDARDAVALHWEGLHGRASLRLRP